MPLTTNFAKLGVRFGLIANWSELTNDLKLLSVPMLIVHYLTNYSWRGKWGDFAGSLQLVER